MSADGSTTREFVFPSPHRHIGRVAGTAEGARRIGPCPFDAIPSCSGEDWGRAFPRQSLQGAGNGKPELAAANAQPPLLPRSGTTPFAHISTCIRSHLRRASIAVPPYPPVLTSFELVGALTAYEIRAVGLRSEERPAVKRGTLWYLDERVLGKGVGAEDPFIRCRREAGLGPSEIDGVYVRGLPPPVVVPPPVVEEDEDDSGMGRGKRKRKASSAAIAALTEPTVVPAFPSPLAIPFTANRTSMHPGHRRTNSTGASASAPAKSAAFVPKLRLRLTRLEEVDSMDDSDGQTSDAQRGRKTKKKARRATSEGGVGMSRAGSTTSGRSLDDMEDDDDRLGRLPAFSSASSSALLAQSLLAASSASSPSHPPTSSQSVVSPNSLHDFPSTSNRLFQHRPAPHHLSVSAPNLFSAFPSAHSPGAMDVDSNDLSTHHGDDLDSVDEDDYHEAMLRGEDFDFEWGSESYTTGLSVPPFSVSQTKSNAKGKERELSAGLPELFDQRDEMDGDGDATSTPATTPRSPPASKEEEYNDPPPPCGRGMQATLCEAFGQEIKEEESDVERSMVGALPSFDFGWNERTGADGVWAAQIAPRLPTRSRRSSWTNSTTRSPSSLFETWTTLPPSRFPFPPHSPSNSLRCFLSPTPSPPTTTLSATRRTTARRTATPTIATWQSRRTTRTRTTISSPSRSRTRGRSNHAPSPPLANPPPTP